MDKLERFIRENREDLDRREPDKTVWIKIKADLSSTNKLVPAWLSIAAIVMVLLGSAAILWSLQKNKSGFLNDSAGLKGLNETEAYYNSLVNTLYKEAKPLLTGQPEIEKELGTDMAQIDSICADIKKDLRDNVANQEVVEALIRNYRIKLQLLEDMLKVMKENDNNPVKTDSHEL